jgi:sugar lactone lactonase YvrE
MQIPHAFRLLRLISVTCLACFFQAELSAQTATFAYAQGTAASGFTQLAGIASDAAGNLYVADASSSSIMRIDAITGAQTTIGSGLKGPGAVAVDGPGNVYFTDASERLQVVPSGTSDQFILGGPLTPGTGIAIDTEGDLWVSLNTNPGLAFINFTSGQLVRYDSVKAGSGVAADATGDVFYGDSGNQLVTEINSVGISNTVASGWTPGGLAVDPTGNLFVADDTNGRIVEFPAGGAAMKVVLTGLDQPKGIAVDGQGRIYFFESGQNTIEELQTGSVNFGSVPFCPGATSTTPNCSRTLSLTFNVTSVNEIYPFSLSANSPAPADFFYQSSTTCGYIASGSTCNAVVTFLPKAVGLRRAATALGNMHNALLSEVHLMGMGVGPLVRYTGGAQTTVGTGLNLPAAVAVDGVGDVFIADTFNSRVVEEPAGGGAQTLVGVQVSLPGGIALDGDGSIYISEVSAGYLVYVPPPGFGSSFNLVTGLTAPAGVAVDGNGDFFVADSNGNAVLKLPVNGTALVPVGTGLNSPQAVAVDTAGNLFIADTGNNRVVEVPANGGAQVEVGSGLSAPDGLAIDAAGDVFVSDSNNNQIVEIPGNGGAQFIVATGLKKPVGLALDSSGNLYVADSGNNRVVKLSSAAPSTLHFATTLVGSKSSDSPRTVVVENVGNQQLSITNVAYPVDFPANLSLTAEGDLCTGETDLKPGVICDLSFDFEPHGPVKDPELFTLTDNNLNAPGSTQSISLSGTAILPQSIVFLLPHSAPFTPTSTKLASYAASTSGLPIVFKLVSGPAKLSGSTLTLTGTGSVVIEATQPGNGSYAAAATVTQTIKITKATPVITWFAPAPIVYGAKLGAAQLNAVASAAGKLVYKPALGTALAAGAQTLSVTFTPTNPAGYASVTATVKITVTKAVLTVAAKDLSVPQGDTLPKLPVTYVGFVNGDTASALAGSPVLTTSAKSTSPEGIYSITVKQGTLAAKNYSFILQDGELLIIPPATNFKGPAKPRPIGDPKSRSGAE